MRLWPAGRGDHVFDYRITLAGLLEDVRGQTYAEYLRRNIWPPLGMTRIGIVGPSTFGPFQAQGYEWNDGAHRAAA